MGREIIEGLRSLLNFYKEIGFDYLPLKDGFKFQASSLKLKDKKILPTTTEDPAYKDGDEGTFLKALREDIGDCQRCKLSKSRTNIVFGEGNPNAKLMFIGEGPGREEDIQARPFVGDAGKVLTSLINKMGFSREDVYIANVVKCRPPNNRNPEDDEIASCMPFLEKQIRIIRPRVIFCLGKIAVQTLLGIKTPISRLRGNFYTYMDIPVMPTFHPAYLLRNPSDKWLTWEDAKKVLEKLNK